MKPMGILEQELHGVDLARFSLPDLALDTIMDRIRPEDIAEAVGTGG